MAIDTVRRRDGAMLWQRDWSLEALPLAWARAENAHGADIYIRPARGQAWAVVFLDDVDPGLALEVAGSNGGLAIRTSPEGGCHLWLPTSSPHGRGRPGSEAAMARPATGSGPGLNVGRAPGASGGV